MMTESAIPTTSKGEVVTPTRTATGTAGKAIKVGSQPIAVAITLQDADSRGRTDARGGPALAT